MPLVIIWSIFILFVALIGSVSLALVYLNIGLVIMLTNGFNGLIKFAFVEKLPPESWRLLK